jgi:hypothetical protein
LVGRLHERERELAAVELLLARGGGVLVVEGRAGIGKTALAEEAGRRAEVLGHQVVRARGSELEAGFAFGVVRQLFERCLADAGAAERKALLAGARRGRPATPVRLAGWGTGWRQFVRGAAWPVLAGGQPGGQQAAADRRRRCALGR